MKDATSKGDYETMEIVLNQIEATIPKDLIPEGDKPKLIKAREQVAILKQKECK